MKPTRRHLLLAIGIGLALLTLASHANTANPQEVSALERRLKDIYEGKTVSLTSSLGRDGYCVELSGREKDMVDSGIPLFVLIDSVRLKKTTVEIRGQRIHFYQDIHKSTLWFAGDKLKYRIHWQGEEPNAEELHKAMGTFIGSPQGFILKDKGYWPPDLPSMSPDDFLTGPSKEISQDIFTMGTDAMPECVRCPDPEYTPVARRNRTEGVIIVLALLTETGRIAGMRIMKSLPDGLNEETIETLSYWRFQPVLRAGKPVRIVFPIEVSFRTFHR